MTNDDLNVNEELTNAEGASEEPINETEETVEAEVVNEPVAEELEVVEEAEAEEVVAEAEKAADAEVIAEAEELAVAEAEAEVPVVAEETAVIDDDDEPTVEKLKAPLVTQISLENFDWDAIGKKHENYSADERTKLEDLYDKTLSSIVEHEVIDGTVVAMNSREVVVNIGFKSDGVIPQSELRYNPNLKVGDQIEVYVESQEDMGGQLLLSHKKARILRSWERVNQAFEKEEVINGYVKCRTKGGLIVDVFGIEAFLPGSQIDVKPIRDYDVYVDKVMEFKVVKINQEYKNVVVSHKALIEDELEQQKADIISKLEKGQILEGTVKNITSYGVFIDLGGVDGLGSHYRPLLGTYQPSGRNRAA